jgi:hypothetical protein
LDLSNQILKVLALNMQSLIVQEVFQLLLVGELYAQVTYFTGVECAF